MNKNKLYKTLGHAEKAFADSVYYPFVYGVDRQYFVNKMFFDNLTVSDAARELGYTL